MVALTLCSLLGAPLVEARRELKKNGGRDDTPTKTPTKTPTSAPTTKAPVTAGPTAALVATSTAAPASRPPPSSGSSKWNPLATPSGNTCQQPTNGRPVEVRDPPQPPLLGLLVVASICA